MITCKYRLHHQRRVESIFLLSNKKSEKSHETLKKFNGIIRKPPVKFVSIRQNKIQKFSSSTQINGATWVGPKGPNPKPIGPYGQIETWVEPVQVGLRLCLQVETHMNQGWFLFGLSQRDFQPVTLGTHVGRLYILQLLKNISNPKIWVPNQDNSQSTQSKLYLGWELRFRFRLGMGQVSSDFMLGNLHTVPLGLG